MDVVPDSTDQKAGGSCPLWGGRDRAYDRRVTNLPMPRFPDEFAWGVATSAYQIEGAVQEDGRGESVWDVFCRKPGAISGGDTGDVAADHFHRWNTDVGLMAELGLTAYRFSIAWPRVQPLGKGPANEPGVDFYDRLTDALLSAGARQVAITNNHAPAWPATDSAADVAAANAYDTLHNRMFADPPLLGRYPDLSAFGVGPGGLDCVRDGDLAVISAPLDAFGVNYYSPTRLSALPDSPLPFRMEPIPGYPLTAFGWPVVPAGLTELLTMLKDRYGERLPTVYVTENGCSGNDQVAADGTVDDPPRIAR